MENVFNFKKALVVLLLFTTSLLQAQAIDVNPTGATESSNTLPELIENVLISGGCATVSNFKSGGNTVGFNSFGYFTNTNAGFPFEQGIILSTGDAKAAVGPNNATVTSGGSFSWLGDSDIKKILDTRYGDSQSTLNATYVQFNFTPKNDRVTFNYVFASEEWGSGSYECPGSTVQDGFAFLIKGPGITPDAEFVGQPNEWKNIALIPETTIPVSVGTIYDNFMCNPEKSYAEFYKTNSPVGSTVATNSAIQFNAQTTVLKVDIAVVKGQVYTMKLVIADRGDEGFDSAVFLEAGSFNLGIDIGDDLTISGGNALCQGEVKTLESNQDLSLGNFQWQKLIGSVFEDIVGENGVNYDVVNAGVYKLAIELGPGCTMEGEVAVEYTELPTAPAIVPDLFECDTDNDSTFLFDLTKQDSNVLNGQSTTIFQIRYFPTEADLDADTNVLIAAGYTNKNTTETIWARIENKESLQCYDKVSFELQLYEGAFPKKAADISEIDVCDNTSVGTLFDGFVIFDLTQRSTEILNGQNVGFSLEFYTDPLLTALSRIGDPVNFENTVVGGQTIYVKMLNNLNSDCFSETSFVVNIEEVPAVPVLTAINQCDDDNDGIYVFDFKSLKDIEILNGQSTVIFDVKYFAAEADAIASTNQITGDYTNSSTTETIWVRLENKDKIACYEVASFQLNVYPTAYPKASGDIADIAYCDNTSFGTDTDGKIVFDLTERATEILNGQNTGFSLFYYTDAGMTSTNEIPNPTSHVNNTIGSETIYVKMLGANDTCAGSTSFNLIVHPLPVITDIVTLKQCDNDSDGVSDFNLNEANSKLSANYQNETFLYYLTKTAAENNVNVISNSTVFTSGITTVWSRIISGKGCYRIAQVDIVVSTTLIPSSFYREFKACDDIADGDNTNGESVFDFSSIEAEILTSGFFPLGQVPIISYYRNEADALAEENKIEDTVNYRNTGYPNEQDIYVRVDSGLNNDCIGFGPHVKLIVNKVPVVSLDTQGVVCLDDLPKSIWVNNIDPLLTYKWTDEEGADVGTGPSIEINKGGDYTVISIDAFGCQSSSKTITMMVSEKAKLSIVAITVEDNSKNNSIAIDAATLGGGAYEYVLNEIDGDYQDEPYFGNIIPGIHMLYVRDKNMCGIAQIEVSVLGFPKFFTPNNDGFNDYWNIKGLSKSMYLKATVAVFDRFGKLLKTFDDNNIGWDGSFNGYRVPSSDYWYVITLIDLKGESRTVKGNFSLIRRKN